MKRKTKILTLLLLVTVLTAVSIINIAVRGKTYTVKLEIPDSDNNDISIDISQEDGTVVECTGKKMADGILSIDFKSVNEGRAFVSVEKDDYFTMFTLYVHKLGIITYANYFGKCSGDIIFPVSIIIVLTYMLVLFILSLRAGLKENMYQYKNIAYFGLCIFISFAIINQVITLGRYNGMIDTINRLINLCTYFSYILLPFAFVLSIIIIASNIVLIKKEGFGFRNLLGIISGILFCILTVLPTVIGKVLDSVAWEETHNMQSKLLYVENFLETFIYMLVTYLECVLIGTIIMSVKSARHIPEFDKDFIVILGCKVKKDGTLTNLLKGRVDRAIEFGNMQKENNGKEIYFVPSGGQGNDESISEAMAMKNYLLQQNISEDRILVEDKSKNTYENMKFSNELIGDKMSEAKIAFSTTNYHVFRAGEIAYNQKINLEGIGAGTKTYFWINAFIREFIATLNSERKSHIVFILFANISVVFMIVMLYMSNLF